jgi:hypothetical protein
MPLDTVYWQKGLLTKEPRTTPLGHGVDPVLDRHGAYRILASRSFSSSLTAAALPGADVDRGSGTVSHANSWSRSRRSFYPAPAAGRATSEVIGVKGAMEARAGPVDSSTTFA